MSVEEDEGVQLVRRAFDLMGRNAEVGALAQLADIWHPEIVYVEDPLFPGSSTYHGLDAVGARFAEYLEVLGSATVAVESVEVGGRGVLALWALTGATDRGVPFEQSWAWVVGIRDGLISEIRAHMDRNAARAEAGA
jgi:ketosteroid isomerase-like protein